MFGDQARYEVCVYVLILAQAEQQLLGAQSKRCPMVVELNDFLADKRQRIYETDFYQRRELNIRLLANTPPLIHRVPESEVPAVSISH